MTKMKIASQLREDSSSLSEMTYKFNQRLLFAYKREQDRRLAAGEPKLTKTAVWKAAGATSGAATPWFAGTNGMSLETCMAVKDVLRCNPFWLWDESMKIDDKFVHSSGTQTLASGAESNLDPAPDLRPARMLPVVGEVQGGVDGYLQELAYPVGYGEGCVEYPTGDLNAYALRVRGDSMHPRYRAGEFVIIEPSIQPPEGEDVIVCCKDGRKMLKILNWIRDGEAQFLSVNNGYAPLTMLLGDIESIQLVAGSVRRSAFIKA